MHVVTFLKQNYWTTVGTSHKTTVKSD